MTWQNMGQTVVTTPSSTGYWQALFQQKTGLNPLSFWTYDLEFADGNRAAGSTNGYGTVVSGTGATAALAAGGVMVLTGPSAGAGAADWSQAAAANQPSNARTKRWIAAYRLACGKAPGAASRVSAGVYVTTTMIGLGYGGADANWQYTRAVNNVTDVVDTGTAIDSSGSVYVWNYLYNDGTNVNYCIDAQGGGLQAIAEASSNIPSAAGYFYLWNEGTGQADVIKLDTVVICCER